MENPSSSEEPTAAEPVVTGETPAQIDAPVETPEPTTPVVKEPEKKAISFTTKEGVRLIKLGRASAGHETAFLLTGDGMVLGWKSKALSLKFGQFNILNLEKMTRLEVGQKTPVFEKWKAKHGAAESRSLSIVHPDPADLSKEKSLDLVCPTDEVFAYVHATLAQTERDVMEDRLDTSPDSEVARVLWRKHDKLRTGFVSWDSMIVILESYGMKGTPCVRRLFDSFDADGDGKLRYKEYMKFVKKATLRPELDTLWTMIVKNEKIRKKFKRPMELKAEKTSESYDTISLGQFTAFWREFMGEFITESTAQRIFAEAFPELVTTTQDKNAVRITQTMWRVAVSNPTNDIFNPNKSQRYMDMSYPLCQYLILSSYQTYSLVHKEKMVRKEKTKKPKSPRLQVYVPGASFVYKNVVDPLITKIKESSPTSKADSKDEAASPSAQVTSRESVGMGVRPEQLGDEEDVIPEEDAIPPADSNSPGAVAPASPSASAPGSPTSVPVSPGSAEGANESAPASPREEEVVCEPSVERYKADLLRGCRYIEIDAVDGEKESVVCMGQSIVTVREILEAVREIAFRKSSYPVIIGVGVFCSAEQQKKLAAVFKSTLKEKLIEPQLDPFGPEDSPDRHKGRILLLHKNTTDEQLKQKDTLTASQSLVINAETIKSPLTAGGPNSGNMSPGAVAQEKSPVSLLGKLPSFSLSPTRSEDGAGTPRSLVTVNSNTQTALLTAEDVHPDLSKLFALSSRQVTDPQKLEGVELNNGAALAFTQDIMLAASTQGLKDLTVYNHTNLSRVFPANSRSRRNEASNNFNPVAGWASGIQLVSVNFDAMDKHAQVAIGRFEENGVSGYLLKPQYLRPKEKYQARAAQHTYDAVVSSMTPPPPMKLTINVLSAHQLPPLPLPLLTPAAPEEAAATDVNTSSPPPASASAPVVAAPAVLNPLVKVTLHDEKGDGAGFSTSVVLDNYFNPVWNQVFNFNVGNSEIAVLNFEILHESSEDYIDENGVNCGKKQQLVAFYSLPVRCVREGLRLCKLYDAAGNRGDNLVASTLLVRTLVEVEDESGAEKKDGDDD